MKAENKSKKSVFDSPLLSTKAKTPNPALFPEGLLGFFLGPMFALISSGIVNTYLSQYWKNVLGLGKSAPLFITLLPIISSIVIIAGNLFIGKLMDRKPRAAGKARPFILLGLPLLAIALVLLFLVPLEFDNTGAPKDPSLICYFIIAIGYNLYYAFAYPFYYTPHSSLINLSCRDSNARSLLATFSNASQVAASGLAGMAGPILIDLLGLLPNPEKNITNEMANQKWTILMIIMIVLLVIGCLLEYYFTRERVTEEQLRLNQGTTEENKANKIPMKDQIKLCVKDKYWWFIIIFFFLYQFGGMMKNISVSFYAQAFSSNGTDMGTASIITTIGAIPTAVGMVLIWPLATKFGKAKTISVGGFLAFLMGMGGFLVLIPSIGDSTAAFSTISTLFFCLKALGTVPAMYISVALISDVIDHQEALTGKRTDGFTMAVYGSIMVAMTGIANGIITGFNSSITWDQTNPEPNRLLNTILFFGVEAVCYLIIAIMFLFMKVEKFSKIDHKTIIADQKAKCLASGKEWIEPEIRKQMEEEANRRETENNRIAYLKHQCEKKGLDFDAEEKKYEEAKAVKDKQAQEKKEAKEKAAAEKAAAKQAEFDALPQEKKDAILAKKKAKEAKLLKEEEKTEAEFALLRKKFN